MTRQLQSGRTCGIYVVQTYAIGDKDQSGIHAFEIQVAPEPDATAPRVAFITTDPRIFQRAAAAEDQPRRFDATWHQITTAFGVKYQIDRFDERT